MKKTISIIIILAYINCYAQDSLYVRISGLSSAPVDGEEQDRQEAVLDAKEKLLNQGSEQEDFDFNRMIEKKNYILHDQGYTRDSTYQVIIEGWAKKKWVSNVRTKGKSSLPPKGEQKDRQETILDAIAEAFKNDGINIGEMLKKETYTITDMGYNSDSTYSVILEGYAESDKNGKHYIRALGIHKAPVKGKQQDRQEAILDAIAEAFKNDGINIGEMLKKEDYTITDMGYACDSTFSVIVEGYAESAKNGKQYIRALGIHKSPVKGEQQDRQDAILNAKINAFKNENVNIGEMLKEEKYNITDFGYDVDSTYRIVLEGWADAEKKGMYYERIVGVSKEPRENKDKDRQEAIMVASNKANTLWNIDINEEANEEKYTLTDLGYDTNGIYQIYIERWAPRLTTGQRLIKGTIIIAGVALVGVAICMGLVALAWSRGG